MKSSGRNPEFSGASPAADVAALDAKLDRMLAVLERIAVAVEGNHRPQQREVGNLLAAIYEAVADRAFTAFEILDHVDVAQAAALGAAIEAAVESRSPRRLGKLLARIEGEAVDGFRVRRVGDSREGLRWRVSRVSSEQTPARSCDGR